MNRFLTIFLTAVLCCLSAISAQNGITGIRPNHITQEVMMQDILNLYNDFKDRHLRSTPSGNYFIYARTWNEIEITHSRAHGFGMIIFAQMAKHDLDARRIFDGMNQLRKAQPSAINSDLMSWAVREEHVNNTNPEDTPEDLGGIMGRTVSATEGDLEIAYALLLAYRQWNEKAYKNEAVTIINALKESNVGTSSRRVLLGDWIHSWDANGLHTLSTDWASGYFRAFAKATGDHFWFEVVDTIYSLLKQVSHSETGLMPGFVSRVPPIPFNPGGQLCECHSQRRELNMNFSEISSLVPWRLALDYAFYATPDAKYSINKISNWLRKTTNENPDSIFGAYFLDGRRFYAQAQPQPPEFSDVAFLAPLASGMIADRNNQEFLNETYNRISGVGRHHDSRRASMQILNMLLITGNWTDPVAENQIRPTSIHKTQKSDNRHGIRFTANPVSERAEINVILPNNERATETKIAIYDMTGNVVWTDKIANERRLSRWDLRNRNGRFVANGTYLVIAEVRSASGIVHRYSARLGVSR